MDADSFTDLALRELAGETTADERLALKKAMSSNPARQVEYEQLQLTYDLLRTTAPMAEATRATDPELPAYRVNELRTAVRQHFGPAASRGQARSGLSTLRVVIRWLTAGGSIVALAMMVLFFQLANQTIEVGVYQTDVVRGGDNTALATSDVPKAKIRSFTQDAPFDQWQNRPLAWNERAKIWVDNEHDVLHIVHRDAQGHIVPETQPLAPTNEGQREQIRQAVESLGGE